MSARGPVLFLCPHNAAKSVLAVAEFNRLAQQQGVSLRADSAGTEPDAAPSPAVVAAQHEEGIDVAGHRPRRVTREDLAAAYRIISFGCDIGALAPPERQSSPGRTCRRSAVIWRRRVRQSASIWNGLWSSWQLNRVRRATTLGRMGDAMGNARPAEGGPDRLSVSDPAL